MGRSRTAKPQSANQAECYQELLFGHVGPLWVRPVDQHLPVGERASHR